MADDLEITFDLSTEPHFDALFEINASGTVWGNIDGNIQDQTDLQNALNTLSTDIENEAATRADNDTLLQDNINSLTSDLNAEITNRETADSTLQGSINTLSVTVTSNYNTLDGKITTNTGNISSLQNTINSYGDIVTYNAANFATSAQGELADSALQPNDNISELVNNVGYITSSALPIVNDATLTIQKNGTNVAIFTANSATNQTANIIVPTQASDINAVPTSRTINGKALTDNISLNYSDVGALSSSTTINDLTTTAQQNALNSGATITNIAQIATNANDISDIEDLIPNQASSSNQLADKDFVNSSISTNTANFIGTFNSVADLEAYSGTLTNNDYAFVVTTDQAGNTLYDRYKWNGTQWLFEYELNNSSFTAAQWAAINSGASTTNIGQISTNASDISDLQTNKQDTINDLATIRSNATNGQSAYSTIQGYGNIVTHNVAEFATSAQGELADSALQPNDNISELNNNAGYITNSALNGYATETYVDNALTDYATQEDLTDGLADKQDNLTAGSNINIETETVSKNLWDPTNSTDTAPGFNITSRTVASDGTISITNNSGNAASRVEEKHTAIELGLENGKTYTITVYCDTFNTTNRPCLIYTNNTYTSIQASEGDTYISYTWTQANDAYVQVGALYFSDYESGTIISYKIQLEQGNVRTGYVAWDVGENVPVISAMDTTYTAGTNVQISSSNVISATDTTYTQGAGIHLDGTEINATADYCDLLIPDTTNMEVLRTLEYDLSQKAWKAFALIPNTLTTSMDYRLSTLFRVTVTGVNINSVYEILISFRGLNNGAITAPYIIVRNTSEAYTNDISGLNQIRVIYPKAIETAYDTYFELYPYNATARHIKIEILKDNSNIEWFDTLSTTTYSGTYQNNTSLNFGTTQGPSLNTTLAIPVNSSVVAGYLTSQLTKIIGICDLTAGEAIVAGLVFVSGDKVYNLSNTVQSIDIDWGVSFCPTAFAADAVITYPNYRQKFGFNSASYTLPSHDAFDTLGLNVYLRCNLVNGEIYSDNYLATTVSAGYTWYCLGKITRVVNGYLALDTTGSFFFTLDSNGNITHINGKEISSPHSLNSISLGASCYSGEVLELNAGWLHSSGQWNDGTVYTTFYNSAVNKIGDNFANGEIVSSTSAYTDYDLVIDTTNQRFRLPLLDGSECLPSDNYTSLGITTLDSTGITFTAPYNCYVYFTGFQSYVVTGLIVEVNGENRWFSGLATGEDAFRPTCYLPVNKGDTVTLKAENATISNIGACGYYKSQGNGNLYFKVANMVQNLELLDVAQITNALTNKCDADGSNATFPHIVETYENGSNWFRLWSDGFYEEGGNLIADATGGLVTINLLKTFKDTNYSIQTTIYTTIPSVSAYYDAVGGIFGKTTNTITLQRPATSWADGRYWEVKGYIS